MGDLFYASISSSAPVEAQLDMRGYMDVLADAYAVGDQGVGGSPECKASIAKGHATIGVLFGSAKGRERIAELFPGVSAESLKSRDNQLNFAGNGVAAFPAQSNDPSCDAPACNIKSICEIMTSSKGDEVDRLAEVAKAQRSLYSAAGVRGKNSTHSK